MDDFALLAARAAALRTKQAGLADTTADLGQTAAVGGGLAAAVGYGAPRGANEYLTRRFGHPRVADAMDKARNLVGKRPPVPKTRFDLAMLARRNAGSLAKTGRGGLYTAAAGLPLWALGSAFGGKGAPPPEVAQAPEPPPAPEPAPPVPEEPDPMAGLTARQANNRTAMNAAKSAVKSWWSRMHAQYAGGGQ